VKETSTDVGSLNIAGVLFMKATTVNPALNASSQNANSVKMHATPVHQPFSHIKMQGLA
jgi:hypothetical protein